MPDPIIPATVIGSWSFPGWFEKFIADVKEHPERFGPADRDEAVRDAVRLAIDDQLRAGLDRITDGEMQRVDFNLGFYEYLRRARADPARPPLGRAGPRSARPVSCVAPLSAPDGLGTVAEYRRLREYTDAPVKMPVPGPFTLAGCIDGGAVYADRDAVTDGPDPDRQRRAQGARRRRGRLHPARRAQLRLPSRRARVLPRRRSPARSRASTPISACIMCFGNYRARAVGHRSYAAAASRTSAGRAVNQLALEFASREMAEVELLAPVARDDGRRRRTGRRQEHLDRARRSWSPSGCGRCCATSTPAAFRSRPTAASRRRPGTSRSPRPGRWSRGSGWSAKS